MVSALDPVPLTHGIERVRTLRRPVSRLGRLGPRRHDREAADASPVPTIDRDEATSVVADLRRYAAQSEQHVRRYTLLETESATAPVVVVDRGGWVQANVDGLRLVIDPLVDKLRATRADPGPLATAIGSRVTGLEAGGLFAFLSNKVLGQFDPFFTGHLRGGRFERDVRRAAAPGGTEHRAGRARAQGGPRRLQALGVPARGDPPGPVHRRTVAARRTCSGEMEQLLAKTDLDPGRLAEMMRQAFERGAQAAARRRGRLAPRHPADTRAAGDHRAADRRHVAARGPRRRRDGRRRAGGRSVRRADPRPCSTPRRAGAGPLDQLIRKLLGFDAKLRQYRDGAVFVRGVLDKVGMAGFNAVWAEPANLPDKDEIADPARWVTRVHG